MLKLCDRDTLGSVLVLCRMESMLWEERKKERKKERKIKR